jgi:hypothetical protein
MQNTTAPRREIAVPATDRIEKTRQSSTDGPSKLARRFSATR